MSKKILYSPGYGAGWSTWQYSIPTKFACEYQPIIEALENRKELHEEHEIIKQYKKDCEEKFDEDCVCVLGASDLKIYEVPDGDQYQITEYDGNESVKLRSSQEWN